MSPLTYEFGGKTYSDDERGEVYDTDTFEYEPDRREVEKLLKLIVAHDYDIEDKENQEVFIEQHYDQLFEENEEYLKTHFEDGAREDYEEQKALDKDSYSYYGVSRKDFLWQKNKE